LEPSEVAEQTYPAVWAKGQVLLQGGE
jgi:hypothetical protein